MKYILTVPLSFFSPLADKHKMERFLRPDAPTVVSVYAPITFSPAGVLLFKQRNDGEGENPVRSWKRWFLVAWRLFGFKLEGARVPLKTT